MEISKNPETNRMSKKIHKNTKESKGEPFTLALIKAGLRAGRVSKEEVEYFQLQIMDILKDLILRYTKGESTSVKVDTAADILNSIIYSIDAGLQSINDPDAAFQIIKNGAVWQVYDKGLALVKACFEESKTLYRNLRKSRLRVGLEAYDLTIDEGLAIFFDKYGPVFEAHHTMASIDYPLLFDDMSIQGVFYFKRYIETLSMENRFCKMVPEEEIKKVLMAHGRIHQMDYTKILINIFELVLSAVFFAVLSEENPVTLVMSDMKYRVLATKLNSLSSVQLDMIIDEGLNMVMHAMGINEKELSDYIRKYKDTLKTRLASALATDSLKNFVLMEDEPLFGKIKTIFTDGERMSDVNFQKLIGRLIKELDITAKASLIKSEVHSLEDFIDILEGSCLFGSEYFYLFSQLSDPELALLAEVVFSDEMRNGPIDLSKSISCKILTSMEWQDQFIKFLAGARYCQV